MGEREKREKNKQEKDTYWKLNADLNSAFSRTMNDNPALLNVSSDTSKLWQSVNTL